MATNESVLTKQDLRRFSRRQLFAGQGGMNYESMQSLGAVYAVGPALEKLYGDDPELLKEKFREHLQFYNSQVTMGACILASTLAIEQTREQKATETAIALRTSLMGPFAGIGDALFGTIPRTVLAAMSAYAAVEGSFLTGCITGVVGMAIIVLARHFLINVGYYQGASMIAEHRDQLNNIREAVSILGIMIVGALCASNVSVTTPLTLTVGESTLEIQTMLDSIIPYLLSLIAVGAVYAGLGLKKMTTMKMVWIIVVVSMVLSVLGLIA